MVSYSRVELTRADVEEIAISVGLPIEGDPAAAADDLGAALGWYVTDARIQRMNGEQATAAEWGAAIAEWAAEGRILLGDPGGVADLPRASAHLCSAIPPIESINEVALLRYVLLAREQEYYNSDYSVNGSQRPTREEVLSSLFDQVVWGLRALQILGKNIKPAQMRTGRPVDRAHLHLVMELSCVFAQLFPTKPFNVRTQVKSEALLSDRRVFSYGPALRWSQMVLTMAHDRCVTVKGESPPEFLELRQWAAKPDGLSKVIRKLNAKTRSKSTD